MIPYVSLKMAELKNNASILYISNMVPLYFGLITTHTKQRLNNGTLEVIKA